DVLFVVCVLLVLPAPRPLLVPSTTLFRSLPGVCPAVRSTRHCRDMDRRGFVRALRDGVSGSFLVGSHSRRRGALSRSRVDPCPGDRKSTRLNSSHRTISYAVFCLKKKKHN